MVLEGMASENDDINDKLDTIVMAENQRYEEGLQAGRVMSKHNSYVGGYEVGVVKGVEFAQEIGFYTGFMDRLMEKMEKEGLTQFTSVKISDKTVQMISDLHKKLLNIYEKPTELELNEGLFSTQVEKIRNKFKQIMSLLKLNVRYQPAGEESM